MRRFSLLLPFFNPNYDFPLVPMSVPSSTAILRMSFSFLNVQFYSGMLGFMTS